MSIALTSKVKDVLLRLGLGERLVEKESVTEQVLWEKLIDNRIEYDKVNMVIEAMRNDSTKKLDEVISQYDSRNM